MINYAMLATDVWEQLHGRRMDKYDCALDAGLSPRTVGRLCSVDQGYKPSLDTYAKVCGWLGVSLDTYLLSNMPNGKEEVRGE